MIQYSLICDADHRFDAWFKSGAAYADQAARGILTCPVCQSSKVDKAMMAPAVARKGAETVSLSARHPEHVGIVAAMRALRERMTTQADYVGPRFAEEARRMHFGEVDPRGIYGEATHDEAKGLAEDGVAFLALPTLPDEHN